MENFIYSSVGSIPSIYVTRRESDLKVSMVRGFIFPKRISLSMSTKACSEVLSSYLMSREQIADFGLSGGKPV
jgi:hypothetical protein